MGIAKWIVAVGGLVGCSTSHLSFETRTLGIPAAARGYQVVTLDDDAGVAAHLPSPPRHRGDVVYRLRSAIAPKADGSPWVVASLLTADLPDAGLDSSLNAEAPEPDAACRSSHSDPRASVAERLQEGVEDAGRLGRVEDVTIAYTDDPASVRAKNDLLDALRPRGPEAPGARLAEKDAADSLRAAVKVWIEVLEADAEQSDPHPKADAPEAELVAAAAYDLAVTRRLCFGQSADALVDVYAVIAATRAPKQGQAHDYLRDLARIRSATPMACGSEAWPDKAKKTEADAGSVSESTVVDATRALYRARWTASPILACKMASVAHSLDPAVFGSGPSPAARDLALEAAARLASPLQGERR